MSVRGLGLLLLLFCLAGCGRELDAAVDQRLAFEPWSETAPLYRFHPGDELDVRLLYNPELSDRVRIAPDGRISLAGIGSVLAEGRTTEELTSDLMARYAHAVTRPDLVVIGRQFESQRVFVGGEVKSPGALTVPGRVGVLEAVILAGGFKDSARTSQIVLMRRGPGGRAMLRSVDTDALSHSADAAEDVMLQSGDVVLVPRSPVAKLDLFVDQYIRQALPFDRGFVYSINQGGALLR